MKSRSGCGYAPWELHREYLEEPLSIRGVKASRHISIRAERDEHPGGRGHPLNGSPGVGVGGALMALPVRG